MSLFAVRVLRCLAVAVLVALLPHSLPAQADEDAQAQKLKSAFEAVVDGTLNKETASEECLLGLSTTEVAASLRQVTAGFLEESQSTSLEVFCNALVEAAIAGSLKPQTVYELMASRDERAQGLALGRVLRAAYFFHDPAAKSIAPEGSR